MGYEVPTRTKHYMLTYRRSNNLEIIRYYDANFAGCQDSRSSTSSYIFTLVRGAICWRGVKQTLVASFTMRVEVIACYEASNHGVWLKILSWGCAFWKVLKDH